jgi:hypothetical protein
VTLTDLTNAQRQGKREKLVHLFFISETAFTAVPPYVARHARRPSEVLALQTACIPSHLQMSIPLITLTVFTKLFTKSYQADANTYHPSISAADTEHPISKGRQLDRPEEKVIRGCRVTKEMNG